MTQNQAFGVIAGIVVIGLLIYFVLFTVMSIAEGVPEATDESEATESPTPTIYLSPTLIGGEATVVTPAQFTSNGTPIATAGDTNLAPGGGIEAQAPGATSAPQVAQAATASNCTPRSDLPVYTVQQGDILSAIAESVGVTTDELITYNCLVNEDQLLVGQPLYVPNLPNVGVGGANVVVTATSGAEIVVATQAPTALNTAVNDVGVGGSTVDAACETGWFFIFEQGQTDPLNACPDVVTNVQAVGQNFQNGRIYVYDAPPLTPETRGIGFVIYNDGSWEAYLDNWDATMPMEDPNLIPPQNMFQPTGAIGKIWRENPELQSKLGWAIEPEEAFVGRAQLPAVTSSYFYIDHGVGGYVLRLTSSADASNTWELVGLYT
jgi:LysM repeat protein